MSILSQVKSHRHKEAKATIIAQHMDDFIDVVLMATHQHI